MDRDLVSVIVPVYKVEKYLRECVNSILAQTYTNLEIILVDDGSPDSGPAICDEYAASDPRVRVIHKDNQGVSAARNTGLDVAEGKWIVFVDSDDTIAPGMIDELVKACPDENTVSAVWFNRFINGDPTQPVVLIESETCTGIREFTRRRSGLFVWGILYSRSLIEKLSLRFDTRIGNLEDVVWNMCYLSHVSRMVFLPVAMYHYRQNPLSITSRCADKHWQVGSWFQARDSVFSWYARHGFSKHSAEILIYLNRYCSNNIFAECVIGKLTYRDYAAQRIIPSDTGIFLPELSAEKYLPQMYYAGYMALMHIRNYLKRRK